MANIIQLNEESGQVFYPQTHEKAVIDSNGNTLDTKIAGTLKYTEQSLTAAQKGQARTNIGAASQDDLVNIQKEEYVTVATLADRPAASASTLGKIYMVGPDANNQYDKYYTSFDGTAYSWVSAGTTEIDLTTYAKQSDLDQLGQEVNQQDVQEEGFYLVDPNLNIGLKFHNGELTVPTKYNGKKISFLGDSITTFGVPDQSNATGTWTYPGNRCRYPQNDLLTDVNYCWWKRLIDKLGASLGINESWAGSRVSNTQATDSGDYGPNRCISSLTRIGHLDDNGTPDIIIVCAGTNDIGGNVTIGTFDTTSPKDLTEQQIAALDVTTFADAYRAMLIRLQYYYQTSRIVVCFPNFTNTYYDMANLDDYIEIIREECDYFGVEYIDLRVSGITIYNRDTYLPDGIHPNAGGMELLFNKVYNYLMGN